MHWCNRYTRNRKEASVFRITSVLLIGIFLFGLWGCATVPETPRGAYTPGVVKAAEKVPFTQAQIGEKLLIQFNNWKGTDYRLGGMSRKGIDCSGFVYVTFKEQLDLSLPRSTKQLAGAGKRVSLNELAIGDLVLFKTGLFDRHVGIYIGDSRFMHASKSQGVTLTRLDDRYWGKRIWMARRVVIPNPGS